MPYLALDSYQCHMMQSVVHAIQDLGVEVLHIPGGCTGLCQPLDFGVNKPLKKIVQEQREDWMCWMRDLGLMVGLLNLQESWLSIGQLMPGTV